MTTDNPGNTQAARPRRRSRTNPAAIARRASAIEDLAAARRGGGLIDDRAAAAALGISRPHWWRLVATYGVAPVRIGRSTRWRLEAVDALVERLARGEGGAP